MNTWPLRVSVEDQKHMKHLLYVAELRYNRMVKQTIAKEMLTFKKQEKCNAELTGVDLKSCDTFLFKWSWKSTSVSRTPAELPLFQSIGIAKEHHTLYGTSSIRAPAAWPADRLKRQRHFTSLC